MLSLGESIKERKEFGNKIIDEETKKNLLKIINIILKDSKSTEFSQPVNFKEYNILDYPEIIKYPSDLDTVKNKLLENKYNSIQECLNEIQLIWDDCKTYNHPQSEYTKMANHCEKLFRKNFERIFHFSLTFSNNKNDEDDENDIINLNEDDYNENNLSICEKFELRDILKNLLIENKTNVLNSIIKCLKHNHQGIVVEKNNKFIINIDNINRNILTQIRYLINYNIK